MYKALIIDDELEAIESVYNAFDWNSLHITDIVKISDQHGLVERIASESPHVVFIDIEMGVVSGLDVIEACSTLLPETMFVIISGHDDFEYARLSIKLDVVYYLLKPFTEYEVDIATEKLMNGLNVRFGSRTGVQLNDINSFLSNKQQFQDFMIESGISFPKSYRFIVVCMEQVNLESLNLCLQSQLIRRYKIGSKKYLLVVEEPLSDSSMILLENTCTIGDVTLGISDVIKSPEEAYRYQNTNCFAYVDRIRPLNFDRKIQKHCYLVIMFEISELENSLESVFDQNKFTLRVLDYNDKILLSANTDEFGQIFVPADHATSSWYKTVKMEQPAWKLCLSIPKAYFGSSETSFLVFMLLAIALNILLLIFLIKVLIQNISESISDIEKEMGIISSGEWGHRIQYQRNNEIGSIAAKLNVLLDEYENMVCKNRDMEEEVHTARLLQLQAQIEQLQEKISPHFLYNSMEYIKGVAQEHGVEKIADITSVLSQNFRYNMDASKPSTVKEDLFYALSYFNVVNSRRKHPIRLNLNLSKEIMEQQIIKMVFQPILENTLKHGDLGENGAVEFSGKITDDGLVSISVRDNGQGIQPETIEKLQASLRDDVNYIKDEKGDHQGILNVHTRLKLTYGPECGISVYSTPGEGADIVVTIRQSGRAIEA